MNVITFSRAAVKAAYKTKVFVSAMVVSVVKLHGRMLDRAVDQAYGVSTRKFEQASILQAAAVNMQDDAESAQVKAKYMEQIVKAEKNGLGLGL